jgi:thiamine-monophosphate kinase
VDEGADEVIHGEAALIQQYLLPLTDDDPGAFSLLDDCAVLSPPPGKDLVLTTDSLVEGIHFLAGDVPGFKALAVNVSDLVAKGAQPIGYLLTLAFAESPTRRLMTKLTAGLAAAQAAFGCHLLGGDTDRTGGPMTLTVTAIGAVPAGRIVRRGGARAGDVVFASGCIGDATLGLRLRLDPALRDGYGLDRASVTSLLDRFDTPRPALALAPVLLEYASAAMDISDGLAKDFLTLCRVSRVSGEVELGKLPLSVGASRALASGRASIDQLVAGGEDYEVLATVPHDRASAFQAAARGAGVDVTAIGTIGGAGQRVRFLDAAGRPVRLEALGWEHL